MRHPPRRVRWPSGSACRHQGSPGTTCPSASGAPSRSKRLSRLPRRPLQPLVPRRLQVLQVLRPRVFRPRPCPATGQPARRPPQRALRRYSLSGRCSGPAASSRGGPRLNRCRRCPSRSRHCIRQCSPRARADSSPCGAPKNRSNTSTRSRLWSSWDSGAASRRTRCDHRSKFECLFPAVTCLRIVERDMPAAPVRSTFLAFRVLHCDGGAWISGCTCIARTAICAPQDA